MDLSSHSEFYQSASRPALHNLLDTLKRGQLGQSAEVHFLIGQLDRVVAGQALDPSQSQRCRSLIQSLEQSPQFSTSPGFVQICIQSRHWLANQESQLLNSMHQTAGHGSDLLRSSSSSGERRQLEIGDQIDRYTIVDKLGQGGMGAVFLCQDDVADRKVAIKVLLEVKNEKHVNAMLDEAKAAASLTHRNCVGIHDLMRETNIGSPAIILEYVPGVDGAGFLNHDIFARCEGHFLTPLSALLILEQMTSGLRAAHSIGIVHQDIKPENFLFDQSIIDQLMEEEDEIGVLTPGAIEEILLQNRQRPWVKLSDLGMALSKERKESDRNLSLSVSFGLSQIPEYKRGGTYVYMPPEQMDGVGISRVTDVFALGLVFYNLLTGLDARIGRKHAEDLEDFHYDSVQTFLVAIASSKAKSAISPKKDPALKSLGLNPALLTLLESMSARNKKERIGSSELATRIEELIDFELENSSSGKGKLAVLVSLALFFLLIPLVFILNQPEEKNQDLPKPKTNDRVEEKKVVEKKAKVLKSNEELWRDIRANKIDEYSDLRASSPGILQRLVDKSPSQLILNRLESLELNDAVILAGYKGRVELKSALRISDEALETLAYSRAEIQLNERYQPILNDLKRKTAALQSRAQTGDKEALKSLKILHDDVAQSLNVLALKDLQLPALLSLTPKAAESLKHVPNQLYLNGLKSLDGPTALVLAKAKAQFLSMNSLERIDEETAIALSDYEGRVLSMSRLKGLTPEIAKALAATRANLWFLNLAELEPEVAKSFSKHKRVLVFGAIKSLSPELAAALAQHEGVGVSLGGLESLSPSTATILLQAKWRFLNLGVKDLDADLARELVTFRGSQLDLGGLRKLSAQAAAILGQFRGAVLGLNGLIELDPASAAGLKAYKGELALRVLKSLSFRSMEALIGFQGRLVMPSLVRVKVATLIGLLENKIALKAPPVALKKAFESYASLLKKQPAVEARLLKGQVEEVKSLLTLSPQAARYLVKRGPSFLMFSSLTYLSAESAQLIAEHKGIINFANLTDITLGAARGLKGFKGSILVTNFRDIDLDIAQAFGELEAAGLDLRCVTELQPGVAKALSSFRGILNLSGVTNLSLEDAQALRGQKGSQLFLKGLKNSSAELGQALSGYHGKAMGFGLAASSNNAFIKALSPYPGVLWFEDVTQLEQGFVNAIQSHEGLLRLGSLKSLDGVLMKALASHRGPVIVPARFQAAFNKLRTQPAKQFQKAVLEGKIKDYRYLCYLNEDLAKAIVGRQSREMVFDFLQELTPEVAEILLKAPRGLSFPSLPKLSLAAAKVLSRYGRRDLKFGALENCPVPVLEELAKHGGWLCFDGWKTLSPEQAGALSKHNGGLRFYGIKDMTPEAAKQLAEHTSYLRIPTLESFNSEAIKALAAHKGRLHVDTCRSVSLRVASALRTHEKILSFDSLQLMSLEVASELAKKADGSLWFGRFRGLTPEFAKAIAPRDKDSLFFNAIRRLSLDSTREIVKFKGDWLVFDGLSTLSEDQAKLFASFPRNLRFYGMKTLSVKAAAALAKHKGVIRIARVHEFSKEAAEAFLKHEGVRIHFHYLKNLKLDFSKMIAKYPGGVDFPDLRTMSVECAKELVKHKGRYIWLPRISELSPELAEVLVTYPGSLSLYGLTDIPDEIAKIMAKRTAKLYGNKPVLEKINSMKSPK